MARNFNNNFKAETTDLLWDVKPCEISVNGVIAPDNYALVRTDNSKILEIHKNSYNPFYNVEFRSLMDDLQKITGFENLTYSEFKGGNVVLGYLENNKGDMQVNGFDVNKYLVLGNSHDGSKGIFLGTSEIMIRCMNAFGKILKSNVVRHTKNNFSRIDDLKRAYEVYFKETEKMQEIYTKMNKIQIDQTLIDLVTKRMFDVDNTEEKISTRKENQILDFHASIKTETNDLGNNLFGLFHGMTHYTTHKLKGENVAGNLFGTASKINEKGFQAIAELIY
jgi:Domain of unknown function (DUF932)